MEKYKIRFIIKEMKDILEYSIMPIIIFLILYNSLLVFILKPTFKLISSFLLRISGYKILINIDLKHFLMSFMGLVTIFILSYIAVLVIFYEFAVIIILLKKSYLKQRINFIEVLIEGVYKLKFINNFSFIGMAFYTLFLIPILNLGIKSSFFPKLEIPKFITGEVLKYKGGEILYIIILGFLFYLFLKLIFVIPIMVIEEKNFDYAARKSFNMVKGNVFKIIALFIIISIVLLIIFLLPILILFLLNKTGIKIFKLFIFLTTGIFVLVLTPIVYTFIFILYKEQENLVYRSSWSEEKLKKFQNKLNIITNNIDSKINKYNRSLIFNFIFIIIFLIILVFVPKTIEYTYKDQLIIGHRGSLKGVENTIKAVKNAAKDGADYAEIDILLSKDNIPMVIHDHSLKRLSGKRKYIFNMTSEEIKTIPIYSKGYTGKIPTLKELNDATKDDIDLLIELKTHGREEGSVVDETVKVVKENNMEKRTKFQTAEYSILKELNEKYPELDVGYIIIGGYGNFSSKNLETIDANFLVFEESMVNKKLVDNIHSIGKPIYVWTVNDKKKAKKLLDMKVDGIITDYPDKLIKLRDK